MSHAARFPLRSTSTSQKESTNSMVTNPQVCIVQPEDVDSNLFNRTNDTLICVTNISNNNCPAFHWAMFTVTSSCLF